VFAAALSPDGKWIVVSCEDGTIHRGRMLIGAGDRVVWKPPRSRGRAAPFRDLALSPTGGTALLAGRLTGGSDKAVLLLNPKAGAAMGTLEGHESDVLAVAVSPDGRKALTGGMETTVRLWDLKTRRQLHCFEDNRKAVHGVAFSPDGRRAAAADSANNVRVWDLQTKKIHRSFDNVLPGKSSSVNSVAFSPDGEYLLCGGHGLRLLDLEEASDR
jgi:WD40 repeat protein